MRITRTYRRNTPDTISGESISVIVTYSSFNKTDIDEIEAKLARGGTGITMIIDKEEKETKNDNET